MRLPCPLPAVHRRLRSRHRRRWPMPDPSCLPDGSASARCFRMPPVLQCARALRQIVRFSAPRLRRVLPMLQQLCRHRPLPVRSFRNLPDMWRGRRAHVTPPLAARPVLRLMPVCRTCPPPPATGWFHPVLARRKTVRKWRARGPGPGPGPGPVAWRCVRQSAANSRYCRATGSILFSGRYVWAVGCARFSLATRGGF